jgi:hypothetical protein
MSGRPIWYCLHVSTTVLFLSHSGVDAEAASLLKRRILQAAPPGFEVWFDKDNLEPGKPWQRQIENAIAQSTSFAVYVGTGGVLNWVEAEVRLALERAMVEPAYRFVPILADAVAGLRGLPGFARQFQAIAETRFDDILAAILRTSDNGPALEAEPFFGLRAIDESRSHLFFGREEETADLAQRVFEQSLVLVSGDSGSGKSSLVRAGLVPQFRGGALASLKGDRPSDHIWHVVIMRPRSRPWTELGDAVDESAKGLGLSVADRGALAEWASSGDTEKARRALRCGFPADAVRTLLVVDQFEELFTTAPQAERERFVTFLVDLADPPDERIRVVLTMRHDYVNLCNSLPDLRARLDAHDRRPRFQLGRMTDAGLERIVTEPLRLAGIDDTNRHLLARAILEEVGTRPGDLALVQMALTETWRVRHEHDGNLLAAYAAVGRVEGSLAKAAEAVRVSQLQTAAHRNFGNLLDSVLVRLVHLGDTGGATRRLAHRDEFDDERWQLIQLLAADEGRRLVLIGGSDEHPTVEIAHEALVTAWPYFQNFLQSVAPQKRVLDALIPKAAAWSAAAATERRQRLVTGAELEWFSTLSRDRNEWLSADERALIAASQSEDQRRKRREQWVRWGSLAAAGAMAALLVMAVWQYGRARSALVRANTSMAASLWNRLDFAETQTLSPDELMALWELRLSASDLRGAAMRELTGNMDRAIRVGLNPDVVLRSLALRWSPDEAKQVFDSIMGAMTRTSDPRQLEPLAQAAAALASHMTPGQAAIAIDQVLDRMQQTQEASQLRAMARPGWALAPRLAAADARRITDKIVDLAKSANAYRLGGLAWVLKQVPGEPTTEQIDACLSSFVTAMATQDATASAPPAIKSVLNALPPELRETEMVKGSLDPLLGAFGQQVANDERVALVQGITALSDRLTGSQAERALTALLKAADTSADLYQLMAVASAMDALAVRLPPEPAQRALQSTMQVFVGLTRTEFLPGPLEGALQRMAERLNPSDAQQAAFIAARATAGTTDQLHVQVFASVLRGVADKLTPSQARDSIDALLQRMSQREVFAFGGAAAAGSLARRLTATESAEVMPHALKGVAQSGNPPLVQVSAAVIEGASSLLTTEQSRAALSAILPTVARTTDSMTQQALVDAIGALAPKLSGSDAQAALSSLISAAPKTTGVLGDPGTQVRFESAVPVLASKLERDQMEPTQTALIAMFSELKSVSPQSPAFMSASQMPWLLSEGLAKRAPTDVVQTIVPLLLRTFEAADPSSIRAAGTLIQLFADNLSPEQAEAGVRSTLTGMSNSVDPATLKSLGQTLQVLSRRLDSRARQTLSLKVQSLLAWSPHEPAAVASAEVLTAVMPRDRPEEYVRTIAEALKYPTSGGQATEALLKAIEDARLGAPGAAAGLESNLDWIARTYQSIDLIAPPACPPPPKPELTCPATVH